MGEIVAVSKEFCGIELKYVVVDSEPWFKGKVVANALGYINTKQAISVNVADEDKKQVKELRGLCHRPLDHNTENQCSLTNMICIPLMQNCLSNGLPKKCDHQYGKPGLTNYPLRSLRHYLEQTCN